MLTNEVKMLPNIEAMIKATQIPELVDLIISQRKECSRHPSL